MFKIIKLWKEYQPEILLGILILTILIVGTYRTLKGVKGTWDPHYYYFGEPTPKAVRKSFVKDGERLESSGEAECRRVMEMLFDRPFPSVRPDFLRNPVTGYLHNLELDCYNKDLKIAVEYNGAQHYKFIPHFHRNRDAFMNQKYRDDMKKRICKERGIFLIDVPYTVKTCNIQYFLIDKLKKNGKLEN